MRRKQRGSVWHCVGELVLNLTLRKERERCHLSVKCLANKSWQSRGRRERKKGRRKYGGQKVKGGWNTRKRRSVFLSFLFCLFLTMFLRHCLFIGIAVCILSLLLHPSLSSLFLSLRFFPSISLLFLLHFLYLSIALLPHVLFRPPTPTPQMHTNYNHTTLNFVRTFH